MTIQNKCKICCADEMIVGRWYKIIAYPRFYTPLQYWCKYTCNNENVMLIHDTIYIKDEGNFTINCIDQYGNTDSKTIKAIKNPFNSINREYYEYTPTSWEDFKSFVTQCGEDSYISIPKNIYNFELTNENYSIPKGTIIDFNFSTINISHTEQVEYAEDGTTIKTPIHYKCFKIDSDYSGLINVKIYGSNDMYGKKDEYSDNCYTIELANAENSIIKNIQFKNVCGFNFLIYSDMDYVTIKPTIGHGRWYDKNNYNGYIDKTTGNLISNNKCWCMKEYSELPICDNNTFVVGCSNVWIPTNVRLYNIAFYDAEGNFIELLEDCQYYREYQYPINAVYYKLGIYQEEEPKNKQPRDDVCVMRIFPCNMNKDCIIENINCISSATGVVNVVGGNQDLHINKIIQPNNGWKYGWSFDIEDSWNSCLNCVISNSFILGNSVHHGVQGWSGVNCILQSAVFHNNIHFPTLINSYLNSANLNGVRCNFTNINSTVKNVNINNDMPIENYMFGNGISSDEVTQFINNYKSMLNKKWM